MIGDTYFITWGGPDYDAIPIDECFSTKEAAMPTFVKNETYIKQQQKLK